MYLPKHYRLMLDDGKWWTYNTDQVCPVDKVDRRLAMRLIRDGYVIDKWIDGRGRIYYKPNPEKSDRLGPVSQP